MNTIQEYNEEPVYYCAHCLSLKILHLPNVTDEDFCDECGSTDIEKTNIETWEKLYKNRYGTKFLNKK